MHIFEKNLFFCYPANLKDLGHKQLYGVCIFPNKEITQAQVKFTVLLRSFLVTLGDLFVRCIFFEKAFPAFWKKNMKQSK